MQTLKTGKQFVPHLFYTSTMQSIKGARECSIARGPTQRLGSLKTDV